MKRKVPAPRRCHLGDDYAPPAAPAAPERTPRVPNCGPRLPLTTIALQKDRCTGAMREPVTDAARAWKAMREAFAGCEARERFVALSMDGKNRPIALHDVSRGNATSAEVDPKVLFSGALMAGANAVIVAHNHPTCDTKPSEPDLALTKRLEQAGAILGVRVLDHLVVCPAADKFHSMATAGEMPLRGAASQRAVPVAGYPEASGDEGVMRVMERRLRRRRFRYSDWKR